MDLKSSKHLVEAQNRASIFLDENGLDGTLARQYWLMLFDWTLTEYVQQLQKPVERGLLEQYEAALKRLVEHEPIQYIVGYADFMDERFKVTPDTLIPREDTAGLIELATNFLQNNPTSRVLDIGTGTGIIPIKLAKSFPTADISACDLSEDALKVAIENAESHNVEIYFVNSDLFNQLDSEAPFDVIISNPPYISENELSLMDESVKKFEPTLALFAEDEGLAIYQRIALEAHNYLNPNGLILLEIGFQQGEAVKAIFQSAFPDAQILIEKDLNSLDRYVKIQL